jgi:hypothetical protein
MRTSRSGIFFLFTRLFILSPCILAFAAGGSFAASEEESASHSDRGTGAETPPSVGSPLARGMMKLLEDEISSSLKRGGSEAAFARFNQYARGTLDRTAGKGRSELSGNCRLPWYDGLLRDPVRAPAAAEDLSRKLHTAVLADSSWLGRVLILAGGKLELTPSELPAVPMPQSGDETIQILKQSLERALVAQRKAIAAFSPAELRLLETQLYPVLTAQPRNGHVLTNRSTGRQLLDLLEDKMDRSAMLQAAVELSPLADVQFLEQLGKIEAGDGGVMVEGAAGSILRSVETSAGTIVIGGLGKNTYDLDKMAGVCAVVDLGGDDEYSQGSVTSQRPILVVIDLDGNDNYVATAPGTQGGAILGVSLLLDLAGNDVFRARDLAQGSTLGGVGILADFGGDDVYSGIRRVQGQAIGGIGLLIDRAGKDRYHAAMWAQGFGGPLGFGILDDASGDDYYFAGGLYLDSYPETPGYEGWSQGVGSGLRGVANGGIGVILDGGGDDVYEVDYMGHGGGYWFGAGIARDFGGNDRRLGATRTAFDGGPRREKQFQRFGNGWGCHYALGFCFDDAGDDTYGGTIMGTGFGWDLSVGVLCDFAGNDRYEAAKQHTQGSGAQASLGILFDYEGDDVYQGTGQGYASRSISYHSLPQCGGNFGFVIDYGGQDQYGCGARNTAYTVRGSQGGFVIDRPKEGELVDSTTSLEATGSKAPADTASESDSK